MQQRTQMQKQTAKASLRQAVLLSSVIIMGICALPFLLAGDWFETVGALLIEQDPGIYFLSFLIIAALTLDVLLPVPSSLVALGAGTLIGDIWGFVVLLTGFTAGAFFGYYVGRHPGRYALRRLTRPEIYRQVEHAMKLSSPLALVICRPIPILAETSVVMAGIGRFSLYAFTGLMLLSNALMAGFYVWISGMIFG